MKLPVTILLSEFFFFQCIGNRKLRGLARPLNFIQSCYNFAGFIRMSKRNLKSVGQSYLRTFIFWDTLVLIQAQFGLAPKYLSNLLFPPFSVTSLHLQRSSDRLELFVSSIRTSMAQLISFASIGPSFSGVARGGQVGASAPGRQGLGAPK